MIKNKMEEREFVIKKASDCLLKQLDGQYNAKDIDVLYWVWKEAQKELLEELKKEIKLDIDSIDILSNWIQKKNLKLGSQE